ncbi:hypothetical protein Ahy_A04g018124 isoform C [Arachis hypogaea]|uniref:Uncharacterized protein n=1 Tax=Arachis hypogaea TaxID=3818 RepID=A0A445DCY7_ARAHY|nr:hypothetical protein Ahy_A04g018124 isoform C [Arachis hypogaea]
MDMISHSPASRNKMLKTKATHGIVLPMDYWYSETKVNWRDLSFSKMCQLKLLILDGVKAPILCDIPCTLKWMHES